MGIMKRTLAFILGCVLMLGCCFSVNAFEEEQIEAKFQLVKVSETTDEVVLNVNLVKGSFISFDIQVATGDNLECKNIARSSELKAWDVDDEMTYASNKDNGKVSVSCPRLCGFESETTLFTYKYTKLKKDGVTASDFTLSVDSFYTRTEGVDKEITELTAFDNAVPATHTHVAGGDFVTIEASTCTKQGTKVKYCTECGDVAVSELLPLAGHTTATRTEDATCTEAGAKITYCSVCNTELGRTPISPKGHTLVSSHKDAKCEEDGYDKSVCDVCKAELSTTVIPATGHLHTDVVITNPTCTESGSKRTYCIDCSKTLETEILYPTGHLNLTTERVEPDCGNAGYIKTICLDCEEVINTVPLPPTGEHGATTPAHLDPTCEEAGYDREICNVCGMIVSEKIIPAKGHTETTTTVDPKCEECGWIITSCTVCEKEIGRVPIPATGHVKTHKDTLAAKCEVAGYDRTVCDACEKIVAETVFPPTGHLHKNVVITDPTCTVDGKSEIFCKDCGKLVDTTVIKSPGHYYSQVSKDPTCEEDGYLGSECVVCKDRPLFVVRKALGHNWGVWTVKKSPTYSEEGYREHTCRTCHKTERETISVIYIKPKEIVILPDNEIKLKLGKTVQLYGNILPVEATYSNTVTWTSSNENVLKVDENGVVTAVGFGTATITAITGKDNDVIATKKIKVGFSLWQWFVNVVLGWITGK